MELIENKECEERNFPFQRKKLKLLPSESQMNILNGIYETSNNSPIHRDHLQSNDINDIKGRTLKSG